MGKAKSGLSGVREWWDDLDFPPNTFIVGDPSYTTLVKDAKGYNTIRTAANNGPGSPFQLHVLEAWLVAGPYIEVVGAFSIVDPLTGLDAVDLVAPVSRKFVKVTVNALGAPFLTASFELGAYFKP